MKPGPLYKEVANVLGRIRLAEWYRLASFEIEMLSGVGTMGIPTAWAPVRFRITYPEPDTVTGIEEKQYGRWWYVESDFNAEAILKSAWAALTMSDEHRRREGFSFDGHRIFDPHKKVSIPGVNS